MCSIMHSFRYPPRHYVLLLTTTFAIVAILLLVFNMTYRYSNAQPRAPSRSSDSWISFDCIHNEGRKFNISAKDFIVLLHIQKTGGTAFEKHLVYDLELETPCECFETKRRCMCRREGFNSSDHGTTWLISRFSTGWLCGLHPDWTEIRSCLRGLKGLFMTTLLRDPIHRFLSEYRHTLRGATWRDAKVHCRSNRTHCFDNLTDWTNLTLDQFLDCRDNLAFNRQTRMLANLQLVGCSRTQRDYDKSLLMSAMKNLEELSYFGLCEYQRASQMVFERTFGLKFKKEFKQSEENRTQILMNELHPETLSRIRLMNHLDIKLYEFGKSLFDKRFRSLTSLDGVDL